MNETRRVEAIGYAFTKEGKHHGKVLFYSTETAMKWFANRGISGEWPRVILTDTCDNLAAEIKEGQVTFPEIVKELQERGLLEKLGSEYEENSSDR